MVGMVRLKLGYTKESVTFRLDQAAEADDITTPVMHACRKGPVALGSSMQAREYAVRGED